MAVDEDGGALGGRPDHGLKVAQFAVNHTLSIAFTDSLGAAARGVVGAVAASPAIVGDLGEVSCQKSEKFDIRLTIAVGATDKDQGRTHAGALEGNGRAIGRLHCLDHPVLLWSRPRLAAKSLGHRHRERRHAMKIQRDGKALPEQGPGARRSPARHARRHSRMTTLPRRLEPCHALM